MANLCDDREFLDHMANDDELVSLVAREITVCLYGSVELEW
jgi:phage/plasmid-associated DNA primase